MKKGKERTLKDIKEAKEEDTGDQVSKTKSSSGWKWMMYGSIILGIACAIAARNPEIQKKSHDALLILGDYLPPSVNTWMQSFHTSKADQKTKTKESTKPEKSKRKSQKRKKHDWMEGPLEDPSLKMMTDEDIKYEDGGRLYLLLVGHVFDVTDGGKEYYSPGSGYHAFIGKDSSRSFVTGDFTEKGLSSNLEGLEHSDYTGLAGWVKFYLEHESYKFVGYHIGTYFDQGGKETAAMAQLKERIKLAEKEAEMEGDLLKLFPMCNTEWTAAAGSRLWCSDKSGGVDRDWAGYPRKFFENASKPPRCSCVHPNYLADPRVQQYEGCPPDSDSCKLLETDT